MNEIKTGSYKHYKGNVYDVIGIARHSETLEKMVVYKTTCLGEVEDLWVRPLTMFTEKLLVDGVELYRFEKI